MTTRKVIGNITILTGNYTRLSHFGLCLTVFLMGRFVDRDMVMRYLGGGIGHFGQRPPIDTNVGPETTYSMYIYSYLTTFRSNTMSLMQL
jgi:hypothetical protein